MAISKIGSDALAAGAPSRSQLPAGTVLQVVSATTTAQTTTTSSSFVSTNLSVSITPTLATSKIIVLVNGGEMDTQGGNAMQGTIYRNNSVNLGNAAGMFTTYVTSTRVQSVASCQAVDSPNTTSATTYTFYIRESFQNNAVYYNQVGSVATIIAMEIAA